MKKLLFVLMVLLALCGMAFAETYTMPYGQNLLLSGIVTTMTHDTLVVTNPSFRASDIKSFNTVAPAVFNIDGTYKSIYTDADGNLCIPFTRQTLQAYNQCYATTVTIGTTKGFDYVFFAYSGEYGVRSGGELNLVARQEPYNIMVVREKGHSLYPTISVAGTRYGTSIISNFPSQYGTAIKVSCTTPGSAEVTLTASGYSDTITLNVFDKPTGIYTPEDNYSVEVSNSVNLEASVLPEGADQRVTYYTDDTDHIAIDEEGNVTGLKSTKNIFGEIDSIPITITSTFDTSVSKTVYVKVLPSPESITITKEDGTVPKKVKTDFPTQLVATVNPKDVSQEVTWESSDESVMTVDENGFVTVVTRESGQSATITATSKVKPSVYASLELNAFVCIEGVSLYYKGTDTEAPKSIVLTPGNSASFEVKFNPSDATEKTMKWKNQNNNIADITENDDLYNNVTITAIAGGTTLFSYVAKNGMGSGLTVYVPWFKVNKPSINVKVGDDPVKSNVVLYPDALRETENVEYVIEDPEIISIDENGYITGLKKGTTTFYAKACGIESEKVTVNVESEYVPVEGISFTDRKLFLHPNDEYTFTVIFNPSNASDKRLKWKVSNKEVLAINDGNIVALANGFSKVEAWSVDGKKVAVCDVYVTDKVSDFKLSKASVTLGVGEITRIVASFKPQQLAGTVEWWVNDDTVAAIDTNNTVCNITGVGLGDTKVYARVDGITLECVVTVEEPEVTEE